MTGCQRNLTLCEPVQLSMPFPLQLWALTGTLTWTSESARRNCAWSASVCEIRRVSWAASLWASTPCPSPAWWKVSRARTKEWEQEGGWRRVTSGDKLHQGTLWWLCRASPHCQHFWRLSLRLHIYTARKHLAAIFTFPFCPPTGYRWVPLWSRDGCSLDPASLFVFVWFS